MLKLPAVQTRLFSKEPGAVRLRCRLWTDNSNFNDRLRQSPMSAEVVYGRTVCSDEWRFYDLHRPFTPRWPVWFVQRPFVSERWKSLTGHGRPPSVTAQLALKRSSRRPHRLLRANPYVFRCWASSLLISYLVVVGDEII